MAPESPHGTGAHLGTGTAAALLVFGRGVTCEAGAWTLTPASRARVATAVAYVTAHRPDVTAHQADGFRPVGNSVARDNAAHDGAGQGNAGQGNAGQGNAGQGNAGQDAAQVGPTHDGAVRTVVLSGGWPEAAEGANAPPAGFREGDLMLEAAASLLAAGGGASGVELRAETSSRSTLENVVNSAVLLAGVSFSAERPLGLVAHPGHLRRARYLVRKVLRLRDEEILDVRVPGEEDRASRRAEWVSGVVSRVWFLGTRDGSALVRRERVLVATARRVDRLRGFLTPGRTPRNDG